LLNYGNSFLIKINFFSLVKKSTFGLVAKVATVYEFATTINDISISTNCVDTINDCTQLGVFGEHVISTLTN
jgi:hypothetical protein